MTDPVHGSEDTPWEPPIAGTEVEQVLGALDRLRWTFRFKTDGLGAAGLGLRIGASSLTLGRLLKHLAVVEDHHFQTKLSGAPMPDDWADNGWDTDVDWELTSADADDPSTLYALWDRAVQRSRASVAVVLGPDGLGAQGLGADGLEGDLLRADGLDQPVHVSVDGQHASLRRLLLDTIEEYGRHTGHADLLREAVDGRVGEDPPAGWRPVSPL